MSTTPTPAAPMRVLDHLNNLTPQQMVQDPKITEKFVTLYNAVHGSKQGEIFYAAEQFYFMKQIQEVSGLKDCSKLSLYGCFMDVAVNGLSFDPTKKQIYIIPRNHKTGAVDAQGKEIWEKRAGLMISPYGELTLRMKSGQIKYADNPVIVYEGDKFSIKDSGGQKTVEFEMQIPRKQGAKIVASFIKIVRADGSVDYSYLLPEDIERLKGYSSRQNYGKPNALYGGDNGDIDSGFLAAKTIKHAFKSYPKVRKGDFSELEEIEPAPLTRINYDIDTPPNNPPSPNNNQDPFTPNTEAPQVVKPSVIVQDHDDVF